MPARNIDRVVQEIRARRPPPSKFQRLATTHALMVGGDAAMVVALADSLFFDMDLNAARTRVMLFLALSFAPFLFVAPLIGPLIDRVPGGRRFVIQVVALARTVLLVLMARYIDSLALFPLVFASLVLQKTYIVSKSALVPSTVRSTTELIEANSKLGLISGLTGAVAVIPAGILLATLGPSATMIYSALLFAAALVSATRLPGDVVAAEGADAVESEQLHSSALQAGALTMTVLRGCVGYTLFHLAFWFRGEENGTFWLAVTVAVSSLAGMAGNFVAPFVRRHLREERMLVASLVVTAVAGIGMAIFGGIFGALVLAAAVNFVAAIARLSFESIVQRDAPGANHGRAFAVFETRFQLAWALAAFIAVALQLPGPMGFLIVGLVAAGTLVHLLVGFGRLAKGTRPTGRRSRRSGRQRNGGSAPTPR
jgi:MFS family permease